MNIRYKPIGEGGFGKVFRTELPYLNDQNEVEHASFCVTKEYKATMNKTAEENADQSVDNFNLIKKAGLKLETASKNHKNVGISLYRLSPDRKSVVTNNLEREGWTIINKQVKGSLLGPQAISIDPSLFQWKELVESVKQEAIKATEKGIELHEHCFSYLRRTDEGEGKEIDFIIGDFDLIKDHSREEKDFDEEAKQKVLERNREAAIESLNIVAQVYANKIIKDVFQSIIHRVFNDLL